METDSEDKRGDGEKWQNAFPARFQPESKRDNLRNGANWRAFSADRRAVAFCECGRQTE